MTDSPYDRIVRTHGDALARVVWGYVDTAADHDDLLQDILVAIWFALPRFRGEASERTFVFRIAHNRACTFLARQTRHEPLADDSHIPDPHPGPDERLDEANQRDRLLAAIRTLPDTLRQTVLLRLEGLSITEIATLQAVSEGNVSVRLTRARDRLRDLLAGDDR